MGQIAHLSPAETPTVTNLSTLSRISPETTQVHTSAYVKPKGLESWQIMLQHARHLQNDGDMYSAYRQILEICCQGVDRWKLSSGVRDNLIMLLKELCAITPAKGNPAEIINHILKTNSAYVECSLSTLGGLLENSLSDDWEKWIPQPYRSGSLLDNPLVASLLVAVIIAYVFHSFGAF